MRKNRRRVIAIVLSFTYGLALGEFTKRSARWVANRLVTWADEAEDE